MSRLKKEFRAQLHEARRIGVDHLAEIGTADVAVDGLRSEKLGVVENVKTLEPKLQRLRFSQAHIFQKRHIVIVHTRSVEKTPFRGTGRSQGVLAELRGIEIRSPVAGIVIQIEGTAGVVRLIDTIIVDAVWFGPEQRIVTVINESDW